MCTRNGDGVKAYSDFFSGRRRFSTAAACCIHNIIILLLLYTYNNNNNNNTRTVLTAEKWSPGNNNNRTIPQCAYRVFSAFRRPIHGENVAGRGMYTYYYRYYYCCDGMKNWYFVCNSGGGLQQATAATTGQMITHTRQWARWGSLAWFLFRSFFDKFPGPRWYNNVYVVHIIHRYLQRECSAKGDDILLHATHKFRKPWDIASLHIIIIIIIVCTRKHHICTRSGDTTCTSRKRS